jgi:hypothetical protein
LGVAAVFVAPPARASMLVDLVTGLAWPLVLLVAIFAFWPQLRELSSLAVERVRQGAAFQVGMLSVSSLAEQTSRLPSPDAGEPVGLGHIALAHTSFLRPDETRRRDDGRTYFQFEVIVVAPADVQERVISVRYELADEWPAHLRVRTVTGPAPWFKLKELAWGTSIVRARVELRGQERPVFLNRYIDLRPRGPRLPG